jgi:hypothetical protein
MATKKTVPTPCSETGGNQTPRLRKGDYAVRDDGAGQFRLYFRARKSSTWMPLGEADWKGTTGIAAHGGWLYLIQDGKLHRVNPENGDWFPRPLTSDPPCQWYLGWPGPIWSNGKHLYAIRHEGANLRRIERLDFDRAHSTVVHRFFVDATTV